MPAPRPFVILLPILLLVTLFPLALVLPPPLGPLTVAGQGTPQYVDASNGLPDYSLWVSKTRFFDLDEDGTDDVLFLGPRKGAGDSSLHVFKWDGNSWSNQSAVEGTTVIGHSSYGGYDLGDLDNDGDWDVGVGSHGAGRVDSYLRFGTGWVRASNGLQAGEDAWSVDAGDFNADGNLDLLVSGFWEFDLHAYAGDGNGNWLDASGGLGTARSRSEAFFCDVNNDGYLDVVSTVGEMLDGTVEWVYRGDGEGNWYNSSQGLPLSGNGDAAACGDFNNDGRADIALAYWDGTVGAYLGDGEGNWEESSFGLTDLNYVSLELVDLNNDKLDDLVAVQDSDPGRVHIFLRDPGGFWTRQTQDLQGNAKGYRLDVGDFDHNGHPDIVAGFGTDNSMDYPGSVRVWEETSVPTELGVSLTHPDGREYLRPGGVSFIRWLSTIPAGSESRAVTIELSTGGAEGPWIPVASDLPDTGFYQWTIPEERTGNGYLRLTLEDSLGASVRDVNDRPFGIDMAAGSHLPATGGPLPYNDPAWLSPVNDTTYAVAWGDVDRDGDDDLAVGTIDGPNLLYLSIDGRLEAQASWTSNDDDPTEDLVWGDINGDEWPDLVAGNGAWGAGNDKVYLNDHGTLEREASWTAGNSDHTNSVALGDYDNDGDLDLATGVYDGYNCLYRNDDGVLTENPVWYSQNGHGTHAVAWADVDDDDDLDLIAGNGGTMDSTDWNRNNVYENQGEAWNYRLTNTPVWYSTDELWTTDIKVVDLDGDGDLDLLAANGYGSDHRVVLYQNQWVESEGDDHLDPEYSWTVAGGSPYEIDVGDLNGDTAPDLAVCHHGAPNQIYLNGGGGLATMSSWNSSDSRNSQSISLGDLEGDGRLDLAVGNQETAQVDGVEAVYTSNRKPVVILLDPADNSVVSGTVVFRGTAHDPDNDTVDSVQLSIDDGQWREAELDPEAGGGAGDVSWSWSWATTEPDNGLHQVRFRALGGWLASAQVNLTVWVFNENYVPWVTIDLPLAGQSVWGVVTLRGQVVDFNDDATEVFWRVDGGPWKVVDEVDPSGVWTHAWDTTKVSEGAHELAVRAFDGLDHSPPVSREVIVDRPNRPPTLMTLDPDDGETLDTGIDIRWYAQDPDDDPLTVSYAWVPEGLTGAITLDDDLPASGQLYWDTLSLPAGPCRLMGSVTDGQYRAWYNVTVLIEHATDADINLDEDAVIGTPREPRAGEEFTLLMVVRNKGTMAGETTLTFTTLSGPEVDLDPVVKTIAGGQSEDLFISWIAEAGTLELMISASPAGEEDDLYDNEIVVFVEVREEEASSGGNGDEGRTPLIVGGLVILAGIVGAILLVRHWHSSPGGAEEGGIASASPLPLPLQVQTQPGTLSLGTAPPQPYPEPSPPEPDEADIDWTDD